MNSHSNNVLKISRTTFLKDPIDAFEIIVPTSKEKRKASSASKLRSKITHHSPSAPFQKEKSTSIIQKHLDRIVSNHNTFTSEKRNSEGNIQKPKTRPQSSKLRKGVTYRTPHKSTRKTLELKQAVFCDHCKEKLALDSPCNCGSKDKVLSISMEIRQLPNTDKFQLIIGKKEFILSPSEPVDLQVKLDTHEKKTLKNSTIGLDNKIQSLLEICHINTPSFQGGGEKMMESGKFKEFSNANEFEVSFAEGNEEMERILKRIEELSGMVKDVLMGRDSLKEFSQGLMKVVEDIGKECGEGKEGLEGVRKVLEMYFQGVLGKESEPRLLHKKLDLRFAGKGNTSAGLVQGSSKLY